MCCVIAAGAIAIKDLPPYGIVAGDPASIINKSSHDHKGIFE